MYFIQPMPINDKYLLLMADTDAIIDYFTFLDFIKKFIIVCAHLRVIKRLRCRTCFANHNRTVFL